MFLQVYAHIFDPELGMITNVFAPIIVAVFALGFPILLQAIERIDIKYETAHLIKCFKQETAYRFYIGTLSCALIFLLIWALKLESPISCYLLEHSAEILVLTSTILLVGSTFYLVKTIYEYYMPNEVLKRLIKKFTTSPNDNLIEDITNVINYAIAHENEAEIDYAIKLFEAIQQASCKEYLYKKIVYPRVFYKSITKIHNFLCKSQNEYTKYAKRIYNILIDTKEHSYTSPQTYQCLWECIVQALQNNKEPWIFDCLTIGNDYFQKLPYAMKNKNGKLIDERLKERVHYIDFNYALAGYLLLSKRYQSLNVLINEYYPEEYSSYLVWPTKPEEAIKYFLYIDSPDHQAIQFPFYSIEKGTEWIKRLVAILFLKCYYEQKPKYETQLELIQLECTALSEWERWAKEITVLRKYVKYYIDNNSTQLYNKDSGQIFLTSTPLNPLQCIDDYTDEINNQITKIKRQIVISPNKIQTFNQIVVQRIKNSLQIYDKLFVGKYRPNDNYIVLDGLVQLQDKTDFATGIDSQNRIDAIARSVPWQIMAELPEIFFKMAYSKHTLEYPNFFKVIDQLHLDPKKFTIISIGNNMNDLQIYAPSLSHKGNEWTYANIPIIDIHSSINILKESLIVIKTNDLPAIRFLDPDTNTINLFSLTEIDKKHKIYTNIIDLNKREYQAVRNHISARYTNVDLDNLVCVAVAFNIVASASCTARCIILQNNNYTADTEVSQLSNIKSIW